ncbi:MAG: hypothetical protein C4521_00750 [Actinobacteria bacterium]|nr:MAG: hypothetical protein C4521_00750 [Actinomycetota bacterium]
MPSCALTSITAEELPLVFDSATLHIDASRGNEWWIQIRGLRSLPQSLLAQTSVKVRVTTATQEQLEGSVTPQVELDEARKAGKGKLAVLEGKDKLRGGLASK